MIFLWFLGIFKREKQKKINCNGHFVVRLPEDTWQSDQNQQQKQCICHAFIGAHGKGAIYCSTFCSPAHDKDGSLPCVLLPGARQRGLFAMRFLPRRTAKISSLPCVLLPDARQRVSHAIWFRCRQLLCFAVHREKTHGKDYLPCVVRRGARQRGFTVQNATVRHDENRTAKRLPCVLGPLPCARQSRYFPLCRCTKLWTLNIWSTLC
jgi:hypothetical protein